MRLADLKDQLKATLCVGFGHSRIVKQSFWYVYCARCGEEVRDVLTQGGLPDVVIVGHDCDICRKNYIKCTWRDKWFAPYPFTGEDSK